MACTVRRSTMSVCLHPARTMPPVGISLMPTSVSALHGLKVRAPIRQHIPHHIQHNELLHFPFTCAFAGRHCEIYKDPCVNVRCQNGGRCETSGLNSSCACPSGYIGERADVRDVLQNDFTTVLLNNFFSCSEQKQFK